MNSDWDCYIPKTEIARLTEWCHFLLRHQEEPLYTLLVLRFPCPRTDFSNDSYVKIQSSLAARMGLAITSKEKLTRLCRVLGCVAITRLVNGTDEALCCLRGFEQYVATIHVLASTTIRRRDSESPLVRELVSVVRCESLAYRWCGVISKLTLFANAATILMLLLFGN